jgi:hypothetical protein
MATVEKQEAKINDYLRLKITILLYQIAGMKEKSLQEYSIPELEQKAKTLRGVLAFFIAIHAVLIVANIILIVRKGFTAVAGSLTVVPMTMLFVLVPARRELVRVKKELESRR